jgi:zinc protease
MHKAINWLAVMGWILLFSLVVTGVAIAVPQDKASPGWPQIKFQKYKLANGLEVILSEDHRLPLVAVNLW